jgi:Helix-turn-helix domain
MKTKTGKSFFFLSSFFLCSILVGFPSAQAADESGIKLTAGQQLMKGQSITLLDGELILQNDRNLVFYVNKTPYWATHTNIKSVTHAIMQQDGNLVLYNNSTPVWTSDTWNVGAQGGYLYCDIATRSVGIYNANGKLVKPLTATAPVTLIDKDEPLLKKQTNRTGAEREKLAADIKRRYAAGESIRALETSTGLSYGYLERMLVESGVNMRENRVKKTR